MKNCPITKLYKKSVLFRWVLRFLIAIIVIAFISEAVSFVGNKSSVPEPVSQTKAVKPPRNMTQDTFNQFNSVLHKDKSKAIEVSVIDGDTEALSFANQIKDYLVKLGYKVEGVNKKKYEKDWVDANIILAPDKSVRTIIVGRQL